MKTSVLGSDLCFNWCVKTSLWGKDLQFNLAEALLCVSVDHITDRCDQLGLRPMASVNCSHVVVFPIIVSH